MITPTENNSAIAEIIGVPNLFFKREDLHPYGSHKGRSIPVMIDCYYKETARRFAISSSGNAALAAAIYIKELNEKFAATNDSKNIELDIFVGNNIAKHKLEKLQKLADKNIRVLIKERPLQALNQAVLDGAVSLRQSTDDHALMGYKSLAEELDQIKNLGAIFIGTSSGTTAQALAKYFSASGKPVQIHIVQTSSCHPLSDEFEAYEGPEEKSVADAIIGITANRKDTLIPLIKKTGGHGWIATNDNIELARNIYKKHTNLDISTNSALSMVGAMQAAYRGWGFPGAVVCLICGE